MKTSKSQKIVKVENLSKYYGKITALDSISFEINPNEVYALIGPNGAGKSTTLKILATVLQPSSGTAAIDGLDVLHDADQVRQVISYLPEEAGAYKNMTGLSYLKFMAAIYSSDPKLQKEYLDFALKIANLDARINSRINTYSKGMARKLLLARAVMTKPKLAILDEPTSGLDVTNSLIIRRIIKDLSKQGMSVLLSSHNMLEIEFLAERVGIIAHGKIIETGTPEELKKKYKSSNLEEVFEQLTK